MVAVVAQPSLPNGRSNVSDGEQQHGFFGWRRPEPEPPPELLGYAPNGVNKDKHKRDLINQAPATDERVL